MDATEGWSDSPTISYSCGEYYERTFNFNQTISHLPAGTYQWRAKAFQRPGKAAECAGANVTAFIYAGTKSAKVAHIMDGAQQSKLGGNESYVNGLYIPNNMEAASKYFNKGLYESHVTSKLATNDGQLKVGLISNSMNSYYWVIFDNFRLCFYGKLTPEEVENSIKGDVNGDGLVNITDVIATVTYMVSPAPPAGFKFGNADIDENRQISIYDVMQIVNMIVGNSD